MAKPKHKAQPELKTSVSFWKNDTNVALLFGGIAFLLYAQTIGYEFALDDVAVTHGNDFVKEGFHGFGKLLSTYYWAGNPSFATANSGIFRPLSMLLFATEWQFFPNSPHVFHFIQVMLYAVSVFLLYKTLRQLFRNYAPFLAVGTTLLWIFMPVHTEVVANVKSADELLSIIFCLLTLGKLLKWAEDGEIKTLLFSGFYFFLALLSKEGALLFLPMALLSLVMFRDVKGKTLIRPAVFFSGFMGVWLIWHVGVISGSSSPMIKYDRGDNILATIHDPIARFATAMNMQAKYFQKLFLGFPLSCDYSYNENPQVGLTDPLALFAILACIGSLFVAYLQYKRAPVLSFGILFYFVTFALTSNVIMLVGATMADRFLFVPSIGAALVITFLLLKFTGAQEKKNSTTALLVLIPILLFYSVRTYSRSQDWSSEVALYTADAQNAPNSGRMQQNYGIILMNTAFKTEKGPQRQSLLDQAYQQFIKAVKIDTSDYRSLLCLGQVEYNRGNYKASASWSKANIDFFKIRNYPPNDKSVYGNLGDAYMMYDRGDSAILAFKEGLDADPKNDYISTNLGAAYLSVGDTTKAIEFFENSVKLNPISERAWDKLANVCGMAGKYQRSTEAFLQLAGFKPLEAGPYKMIATNYMMMGDSINAQKYWLEYKNRGGK